MTERQIDVQGGKPEAGGKLARQAVGTIEIDGSTGGILEASWPGAGIGEPGAGLEIDGIDCDVVAALERQAQEIDGVGRSFIGGGEALKLRSMMLIFEHALAVERAPAIGAVDTGLQQ